MGKIIEYGVALISAADGATSINSQSTPIEISSTSGQIISRTLSLIGPGTTLATAPAAMTLTMAKIAIDIRDENRINPGDILSLTGKYRSNYRLCWLGSRRFC